MSKVYVEILGHKAEVKSIQGKLKHPPWHNEDYLDVWLEFEEAVGSTLGFGISLPVLNYGKDELLHRIRVEGEVELKGLQNKDAERRIMREVALTRQQELDSLAGQLQSMISK